MISIFVITRCDAGRLRRRCGCLRCVVARYVSVRVNHVVAVQSRSVSMATWMPSTNKEPYIAKPVHSTYWPSSIVADNLTNPRNALHHDKRQNFKTITCDHNLAPFVGDMSFSCKNWCGLPGLGGREGSTTNDSWRQKTVEFRSYYVALFAWSYTFSRFDHLPACNRHTDTGWRLMPAHR